MFFFFFKQKTAYEMRISDWSSDVCSSDLPDPLTVLGIANTNQQDPISGTSTAKEAYLELSVPILADKPFFEALTAGGAVRYSDYDLFGSDRSAEQTSELQSLLRISSDVFFWTQNKK